MAAVANNPAFAKKTGIPQSVGQDFMDADKGKKFSGGVKSMAESQAVNQPKTQHGNQELFKRGGMMRKMKEGSAAEEKTESKKFEKKEDMGMKRGGMMKKMAKGGETMGPRSMSEDVESGSNKHGMHGESKLQKKGHTKAMMPKMKGNDIGTGPEVNVKKKGGAIKKYAKGGFVLGEPMSPVESGGKKGRGEHSIQQKGFTRAMMPKM
jgi:hypothetical protein